MHTHSPPQSIYQPSLENDDELSIKVLERNISLFLKKYIPFTVNVLSGEGFSLSLFSQSPTRADLDQVKITNSQGKNFQCLPKIGEQFLKSEQNWEISDFFQGLFIF